MATDTVPHSEENKRVDLETATYARRSDSIGSIDKAEVFSLQSVDPALNAKMHLVNDVRRMVPHSKEKRDTDES